MSKNSVTARERYDAMRALQLLEEQRHDEELCRKFTNEDSMSFKKEQEDGLHKA